MTYFWLNIHDISQCKYEYLLLEEGYFIEILHLMFQINELKVMDRGWGEDGAGGRGRWGGSLGADLDVCFLQKKIPDSVTQTH